MINFCFCYCSDITFFNDTKFCALDADVFVLANNIKLN